MPADAALASRRGLARRPVGVTSVLVGAAALSWVALLERRHTMMGMTMGIDAVAFLVVWLAMVGAMMLPTIQPMLVTYLALLRHASRRVRWSRAVAFLAPYAALWAAAGVAALGLWHVGRDHPVFAGGLLAGAGLYQLGPVKTRCLRWCRSPLGFLMRSGADARSLPGAVALGSRHGAVCFGCCAGLMVGLTGAGVMSITWLIGLGLLMLLEKTHRAGPALARASGLTLVVLGATTAVIPMARVTGEATGIAAIGALAGAALASSRGRTSPIAP